MIGNTDIEDSLERLDKLTQEEARMASAEQLRIAHNVEERVMGVDDRVKGVDRKLDDTNRSSSLAYYSLSYSKSSCLFTGNLLRDDLLRWLSPSDPSINHNIASNAHHDGTAQWFFEGSIFNEWKSSGSFLWIHGKREFILTSTLRPQS